MTWFSRFWDKRRGKFEFIYLRYILIFKFRFSFIFRDRFCLQEKLYFNRFFNSNYNFYLLVPFLVIKFMQTEETFPFRNKKLLFLLKLV